MIGMKTSARNEFAGTVKILEKGVVNTEVMLDIGEGEELVAVITHESVESLGLKVGASACAHIKSSHVVLAVAE